MKRCFVKLSSCFLAVAFVIGQLTANSACALEFYQPKVPAELKK